MVDLPQGDSADAESFPIARVDACQPRARLHGLTDYWKVDYVR
jgi:hypothetical protein